MQTTRIKVGLLLFVFLFCGFNGYGQKKTGQTDNSNEKRDIILNLNNVDLRAVIDTFSKATGYSFIVDDRLLQGKKVNFKSEKKFTIDEAYRIFEAILDAEGLGMVKEDPYIKIIAKQSGVRYLTPIDVTTADKKKSFIVTQVIQLKNSDVNVIRNTIQPFLTETTNINQYVPENLIIIRDKYQNIERIRKLIELIDKNKGSIQAKRFKLNYIRLNNLVAMVSKIFQSQLQRAGGKTAIFPENETNSLIVLGDKSFINQVSKLIEQIDNANAQNATEARIINLQHANTADIMDLIKQILTDNGKQKVNYQLVQSTDKQLVLFSTESIYNRIINIIQEFDIVSFSVNLEIIDVKNAAASDMVTLINSIFDGGATKKNAATGKSTFKLLADRRTNKLIVLAKDSIINKIKLLLAEFDQKVGTESGNYRVYRLNYTSAAEVSVVLQGVTKGIIQQTNKEAAPVATRKTDISIIPDKSTNSLVIYASQEQFSILEKVINELDVVRPQVYVEAMIMEVSLNKSLELGADWKSVDRITKDGEIQAVAVATGGGSTAGLSAFPDAPSNGAVIGVFGKPFSFGGQTYGTFSAFIRAQQIDTEVNVLASPQIMTLNNVKAKIKSGETKGYEKEVILDANGNQKTTYDYKDIGVDLEITPQINPDNSVRMDIITKYSNVNKQATSTSQNLLDTFNREITTSVSVRDDNIVVLGGLISDKIDFSERKIPCLGDIPLIGWLFKSTTESKQKTNLLVFISPKIISTEEELKISIENIKEKFNEATSNRFRMNVSEEFGIPGIIDVNMDEADYEQYKKGIKKKPALKKKSQEKEPETVKPQPVENVNTSETKRIENFDTGTSSINVGTGIGSTQNNTKSATTPATTETKTPSTTETKTPVQPKKTQ